MSHNKFPSTGVNDHLIDKIIRSPYFLQTCASLDSSSSLLTIAELVIDIDLINGHKYDVRTYLLVLKNKKNEFTFSCSPDSYCKLIVNKYDKNDLTPNGQI